MNFKQKVYTTLDGSSANLHVIDTEQTPTSETVKNIAADLQYLDQKLAAISKDIQVLDILTITNSASSYEEYLSKVSLLINGEGISIANSFEDFNTGDIVYKINNQLVHLAFAASGWYYPSQIEKQETGYSLTFSYQQGGDIPTGNTEVCENAEHKWIAQSGKAQYTFTNLSGISASNIISYNKYFEITNEKSKTFDVLKDTSDCTLMPLIKMFKYTNGYLEQIECEFSLTQVTEDSKLQWKISEYPSFVSVITVR